MVYHSLRLPQPPSMKRFTSEWVDARCEEKNCSSDREFRARELSTMKVLISECDLHVRFRAGIVHCKRTPSERVCSRSENTDNCGTGNWHHNPANMWGNVKRTLVCGCQREIQWNSCISEETQCLVFIPPKKAHLKAFVSIAIFEQVHVCSRISNWKFARS